MSIIYDNFNLGVVMLGALFVIIMNFYTYNEKQYYIWIFDKTPLRIIVNKIVTAYKYSALIIAPVLISLLVFFFSDVTTILIVLLISFFYLASIVIMKYALYDFKSDIEKCIMYLIMIFIPVTIILFYFRAVKNIKNISNDNDRES